MPNRESLKNYAKLIVRMGINPDEGKYVLLNCPIEAAELARLIEEEAFEAGAKDVIISWNDDKAARIRLERAALSQFETVPEWRAESRNYYAREGCCSITIVGNDPEAFAGVPSEKLRASTLAGRKAFKEFYKIMDSGKLRWTIAAYPGREWAMKVFPEMSEADAIEALWESIFKTVRIGDCDTVEAWKEHDATLKHRAKVLTDERFTALRYKNSLGTDFTVGLANGHIWRGGSDTSAEGIDYFANLPTEEVFTMPDCRVADGMVYSSMPLSYQGEKIDGFWLKFESGRVVEHGAKVGEHALTRLLDTDEGSRSLGEVALIPYESPIRKLGIFFFETLFDENASCHLALGECYPDTMEGGDKLTEDELYERGGNRSANHVDFMIGTADLEIVGIAHSNVNKILGIDL